jgi:hypothetical protein
MRMRSPSLRDDRLRGREALAVDGVAERAVVEDHHDVLVDGLLGGILDDERAEQAHRHLRAEL